MNDQPRQALSVITAYANERGMERDDLVTVMMATIMPKSKTNADLATKADLIGFLQICKRFDLDPWAREIFMIVTKGGVLRPYISVDGYSRMANRQPDYDGCEFEYERGVIRVLRPDPDNNNEMVMTDIDGIAAITCRLHIKGRAFPTVVTEFFDECWRNSEPWNKSPSRMLRHRAFIQAVRLAFGISGAFDYDAVNEIPATAGSGDGPLLDGATMKEVELEMRTNPSVETGDTDKKPKPPAAPKKPPAAPAKKTAEKAVQSDLDDPGTEGPEKGGEQAGAPATRRDTQESTDAFVDRLAGKLKDCDSDDEIDQLLEAEDVEAVLTGDQDAIDLAVALVAKARKRVNKKR